MGYHPLSKEAVREVIEKLKVRLGILDADFDTERLLICLLEDAEAEILDYTNRVCMIKPLEVLQRDLAALYYRQMGHEGESSRVEGGISVSYVVEIPESIKCRLNAYRLLKGAKIANATNK